MRNNSRKRWFRHLTLTKKQHHTSYFKQDVVHYYLNSFEPYLHVTLRCGLPSGRMDQRIFHQNKEEDFLKEKNLFQETLDMRMNYYTQSFRNGYPTSTQELDVQIIHELRSEFQLKILLQVTKFPKATHMYGNYGYHQVQLTFKEQGLKVNQKKYGELCVNLE